MGHKKCCGPTTICGQCDCNPCKCKTSCCQEVVPSTPSPFYNEASVCVQDHNSCTVINKFAASVKVANAFNMPDCDQSAELNIPGLKDITIGSYLWNAGVGYLQVVSFNAFDEIVTVQNNCNTGNASPGTTVPVCTLFTVTDPPSESGGGPSPTGIFVAIDFTAPDVGDCLLITVTGVDGLAVGKDVAIGSGVYRLQAINSSTTITICNDGDGITPGSPVIARNGAGQYQYPITLIDVNACTNEPVAQGALLVCADGISQPLDGTAAGQVPVLVDPDTNYVEFRTLEVPTRTCTTILCCLTLVNGFAGPYIISVTDSSQFTVGDILQIGSRTDRVTITAIDDATTIRGTIAPTPGATVDIPIATSICIIECCEDLQNQIDDIEEEIGEIQDELDGLPCAALNMQLNDINLPASNAEINFAIYNDPDHLSYSGTIVSQDTENESACRNMVFHYNITVTIYGQWEGGGDHSDPGCINVGLLYAIDGGAPDTQYTLRKSIRTLSADEAEDFQIVFSGTQVVPPASIFHISARAFVSYESGNAEYTIESATIQVSGIGTT